jgi:hypothetical protein
MKHGEASWSSVSGARSQLFEQRVCLARGSGANQQGRELSDERIGPGRQGTRPFGQRERFLEPSLLRADSTERTDGQREVLIELQDLAQFGFRLLESAGVPEAHGEMVTEQEIERILRESSAIASTASCVRPIGNK